MPRHLTSAVVANKQKARIHVAYNNGLECFQFQAFQIGEAVLPFAAGNVRAPNERAARRFARMKVDSKLPGFVPYVAGCSPC